MAKQQKNALKQQSGLPGEIEVRQRMKDLKRKVIAASSRELTDEAIAQRVDSEQALVAEDERLLPLLEEAQSTILEFEELLQKRTATDKENLQEFEELKQLVTQLEQERDVALAKAELTQKRYEEDIKSLTAAHQRELNQMGERVAQVLGSTLDKFLKDMEELEIKRAYLFEQQKKQEEDFAGFAPKIDAVIKQAAAKLKPGMTATLTALEGVGTTKHYTEYITNLGAYRKELGWTRFTEKGAVDYVLDKKALFLEGDEKSSAYEKIRAEVKILDEEIRKRLDQYKTLIIEAEKEKT